MWTVIYIATDRKTALSVEKAIEREGFLVRTRDAIKGRYNNCCIEIIVPESEAQEVQKFILEQNL